MTYEHWSGGDSIKNRCKHSKDCILLSPSFCVDCTNFNEKISRIGESTYIFPGILIWGNDETFKNNK